jgi:ELP3 family radical SAM enzyme/protein acetyltransferase
MSCSTTQHFQQDVDDIENIFLNKDAINIAKIKSNIPTYKKIVTDIYEWMEHTIENNPTENIRTKFIKYYNKIIRSHRIFLKKSILVFIYRNMITHGEIDNHPIMWTLIQKCPARNMSGVTVITVLTSPYPLSQEFSCKHNCYYCPNEPDMPRSYLKKEPAVARGFRNKWDPQLQMEDRLKGLIINGHEIDKLEIIIEGGTYTEYPEQYLKDFHRRLIYTANTFFDDVDTRRDAFDIETEIRLNAEARVRIVGICIETRPDALIDDFGVSWLPRFRKWGVTRVQLGVQHTDNTILKKINRGHTIEDAETAIKYLKDNCFKVDIHLMPDLPNANPEKDKKMFDYVFKGDTIQPDQVKIYPCEVTPWTIIKQWHERGKYIPYAQTNERAMLDVVKYAMEICPPWIRLPRIIRDIPLSYIQGGNMYPNLRQMLMDELHKEDRITMDIRARECGRNLQYKIEDADFVYRAYKASGGTEYFISLESFDRNCIFGFIRLRIPNKLVVGRTEFSILTEDTALIRELHVYGNVIPVGFQKKVDIQHKGVGRSLVSYAENMAIHNKCTSIAVISGIGVVNYYKKLGYKMDNSFMIKHFKKNNEIESNILAFLYIFIIMSIFICIQHILYTF